MPSGWIIAVIVVLWAAVLIPSLLRHHDETTESKSVDRFMRAMRTLRREDVLPEHDDTVLMPHRPAASVAPHIFSKADRPVVPAAKSGSVRESARTSARSAVATVRRPATRSLIARRRRALLALLGAAVLTFLAALAVGGAIWALHGLVVGMSAVYVVHLRAEARRAALARRRRSRSSVAAPTAQSPAAESPAFASERLGERSPAVEPAVFAGSGLAETFGAMAAQGNGLATTAEPVEESTSSRAWQPIPVPVPTYVTAPKAPRRGKQVEVPPSWSDGLPWAEQDDAGIDLVSLKRAEPEVEHLVERRRAVND